MTSFRPQPASIQSVRVNNVVPFAPRTTHPERDFGIGYRRSSGYASARRYVSNWAPPRFRCA